MKVTIVVSCSRTSRVARAQKGLTCPIGLGHVIIRKWQQMINSYPNPERSKVESERYSSTTLINFLMKETCIV